MDERCPTTGRVCDVLVAFNQLEDVAEGLFIKGLVTRDSVAQTLRGNEAEILQAAQSLCVEDKCGAAAVGAAISIRLGALNNTQNQFRR